MNYVTVLLIMILLIPIAIGAFGYFSKERIQRSVYSLFGNIEILLAIILSILFVRKVLIEHNEGIYIKIFEFLPEAVKAAFIGQAVMSYIVFVPVLLVIIMLIFRIITFPIYKFVIDPLSDILYKILASMNGILRRMIGAIAKVPKAVFGVLVIGLLLNFYTYYFYSPKLTGWMNESAAYQFLYRKAIYPMLDSNLAKQIPVIVNDSFRKSFDRLPVTDSSNSDTAKKFIKELEKRNIKVIEYFNGVTLEEAIKSNEEIDQMAKKIVGDEKNSTRKGYLIYKWISKNIKYDYAKAEQVSKNPRGTSSGAITAFETGKGICFDHSSLYVAMCRAVGLEVRLVTGLGYSGVIWGDHAWNQVYSEEEKRWIDADCTFGAAANYFDKKDFEVDHKDSDIQGEW